MKQGFGRGAMALSMLLAAGSALSQDGPQKLASIRLQAGIHNISAELATTAQEREIGLMNRTSMGTNEGMLFVFERPARQCFWMKNTLIPLSIAFLADDGSVVNIDSMKPHTLEPHCSDKPVRFVLEMNEGWFAKRGIKAGTKVRGQPFAN